MYHVSASGKVGRTLGLARSRYFESSHVSRHVSRPVRNTSPRPNFTYRAGWSYPWTIDRGFLRPSRKFDTFRSRAKTIVHRSLRERSNCFREHFDDIQIDSRLFSEYLSLIRSKRNKFLVFRKHLSASWDSDVTRNLVSFDRYWATRVSRARSATPLGQLLVKMRLLLRATFPAPAPPPISSILSFTCFRYRELLINSSSFRYLDRRLPRTAVLSVVAAPFCLVPLFR